MGGWIEGGGEDGDWMVFDSLCMYPGEVGVEWEEGGGRRKEGGGKEEEEDGMGGLQRKQEHHLGSWE